MLLCCFLNTRTGEITEISFIDSTPINVCHIVTRFHPSSLSAKRKALGKTRFLVNTLI